jgi:hypothetical protein
MKGFLGEWLEKSGKVKDGILTPMVDMLPEDRELAAAKLYD